MNHYCSQHHSYHSGCYGCIIASIRFQHHPHHHIIVPSSVLSAQSSRNTHSHTPRDPVGLVWHPGPGKHGTAHPCHHNSGLIWRGPNRPNVHSLSTHHGTQRSPFNWGPHNSHSLQLHIPVPDNFHRRSTAFCQSFGRGTRRHLIVKLWPSISFPNIWRHTNNLRNTNQSRSPR